MTFLTFWGDMIFSLNLNEFQYFDMQGLILVLWHHDIQRQSSLWSYFININLK